jgi:ketosteroid isomerase-like protein
MQGTIMHTPEDATKLITELSGQWAAALRDHRYDWFERHLAEDFVFTAHPFPGVHLKKQMFIEVDKKIDKAEIQFVSIHAEAAGDIIISRTVADVKEEFGADLGPGMPTAVEVTQMLSGKRLAYTSAWRNVGSIWQCFDHHMVGPVKRT